MRLKSLVLQRNASLIPPKEKENKNCDGGDEIEKQISNFVREVRKELIISLGWEEDVTDRAGSVFNPFLFLSNLTQLLESLTLRRAGWAYVTAGRSGVKNGGINPFYSSQHFALGTLLYFCGVACQDDPIQLLQVQRMTESRKNLEKGVLLFPLFRVAVVQASGINFFTPSQL